MEERKSLDLDLDLDFEEEEGKEESNNKTDKRVLSLEETIIKKYKLGMNLTKIIQDHDISSGKLYDILNRNKVPLRAGRYNSDSNDRISKMSKIEKMSLIEDYNKGVPLVTIYKKHKINKHGCYQILDENNVPRRQNKSYKATEYALGAAIVDYITNSGTINKVVDDEMIIASISEGHLHINLNTGNLDLNKITIALK